MKQFVLKPEFIGRSMEDIEENFRFPTIIENIKVVIATGNILEKEIQTIDMRWFQMNILPYIDRIDNKTNGVIITFVDITARVKDLRDQEKLVAEHELLLDTIAHDIKNPILGIALSLEAMKLNPEKTAAALPKLIGAMERSLTNIKQVLEDLVQSHWDRQRYQSAEELIDIQHIIEDVRLSIAALIHETGTEISFELKVSEINFVRRKLRSILYNLISNAIKYTPKDRIPKVKILTENEDGNFIIRVIDNGMGLSTETKHIIFEKFKRAKTGVEGSGVGLYLVNTIVSNAGGKITIASNPGEGSEFKVFLPL
ncbi:ATP-binding protein [Pedobacter aquatilis]|uniref:ATP-binding protein n=1 Tax=Pedobacter aquatilis TaxID=351343 RepID=UPI00292D14F3|nr:ATP-binding protein [Pedobacter aquatilis]